MQPSTVRRVPVLLMVMAISLAACGRTAGTPIELPGGTAARSWGDGPYGLVLVHDTGREAASWDAQAVAFAGRGMSVLAVEDAEAVSVINAITWLQSSGIERVAVLGAGEGSVPVMAVGAQRPELVDQLILISATGDVAALGAFPKLFVVSEQEGAAADAERMATEARGDWNALFLAPGSESGQAILQGAAGEATMEAVIRRLEERR
jgi:pimeloyl-ACP methyl ester carboxylesterase